MSAASLGLSASQYANAVGILAAVRARRLPAKAAVIAVETALTEAGLRMIASANVPESQRYPYERLAWTSDGLGHDHASMGLFQQQTGTAWTPAGYGPDMSQTTMNSPNGWGTPAQLMDAATSTAAFLTALSAVAWASRDNWVAAQDVQHSAYDGNPRAANNFSSVYGGNYQQADAHATQIVDALWTTAPDTTTKGDPMNLIFAAGRGIGYLVPGGKYHVGPGEWAAISAARKAAPAGFSYSVISAANWDALAEKRGTL